MVVSLATKFSIVSWMGWILRWKKDSVIVCREKTSGVWNCLGPWMTNVIRHWKQVKDNHFILVLMVFRLSGLIQTCWENEANLYWGPRCLERQLDDSLSGAVVKAGWLLKTRGRMLERSEREGIHCRFGKIVHEQNDSQIFNTRKSLIQQIETPVWYRPTITDSL